MDHLEYLFLGFAVFWAALFAYTLWLQARLRAVSRELERLEERLADSERDTDAVRSARRPESPTTPVATSGSRPQRTTE